MKIAFGVRREDKRRRKKTKPGQRRQFFALPHKVPPSVCPKFIL